MNRTSRPISGRINTALDRLDTSLSRLGSYGAAAALSAMAVVVAFGVHFLTHVLQGEPVRVHVLVNIGLDIMLVTAPIIFYARSVIDKLKASRAQMDMMARRLAISVEQAENANRAKSAFLANMSHELRTPLNAILGFSEIMMGEHLGPMGNGRYRGYCNDIHTSGSHLLGIINDILDLSKIEAGKMSLDAAEEFPLADALENSLTLIAPIAEKYGVALVSELPPTHIRLLAVERMIRQIVINLVGNAVKFTPAGGEVVVMGERKADGGYAVIVKDSGIGMNAEEIAKALVPFGQIANKMTATHTGTGLGLPLAKAMLELHGGDLAISSVPHHGTTIVLNFPASRIALAKRAAA